MHILQRQLFGNNVYFTYPTLAVANGNHLVPMCQQPFNSHIAVAVRVLGSAQNQRFILACHKKYRFVVINFHQKYRSVDIGSIQKNNVCISFSSIF